MKKFFALITLGCCLGNVFAQDRAYDIALLEVKGLLAKEKYSEVIVLMSDLIIADFTRYEAYYYISIGFLESGDYNRAEEYAQRAMAKVPAQDKPRVQELLQKIGTTRTYEQLKTEAETFLAAGDRYDALEKYKTASSLAPAGNYEAITSALTIYLEDKKHLAALQWLVTLPPTNDAELNGYRTRLVNGLKKTPEVKRHESYTEHITRGDASFRVKDYDAALDSYNKAYVLIASTELKDKISVTEEENTFLKADRKQTVDSFKDYLRKYRYGKYAERAHDMIRKIYIRQAKDAFQSNDVPELERLNSAYGRDYSNDTNLQNIRALLGNLYFSNAERLKEFRKDISANEKANTYYKNYLALHPGSINKQAATKGQKITARRIRIANIPDRIFFTYSLHKEANIGLSIGTINQRQAGFYLTIITNSELLSTSTTYWQTNDKLEHTGSVFSDIRHTKNSKHGLLDFTTGFTAKPVRPIWLYAGAGVRYSVRFMEFDQYDSGEYYDTVWARNTDQTKILPVVEGGIILDFSSLNIRGGINVVNFKSYHPSFGIGFSFLR